MGLLPSPAPYKDLHHMVRMALCLLAQVTRLPSFSHLLRSDEIFIPRPGTFIYPSPAASRLNTGWDKERNEG
ncbi:hypothetical protein CHARACLAT_020669 [Characodon lateralis]|uniref:Uncharacterized protein n=1 Tax=Characodon lateralis TaxID=208331 RepID=A0ABU7EWK1_9TELE|nr:hypothetical protein [Characodon lateralis]